MLPKQDINTSSNKSLKNNVTRDNQHDNIDHHELHLLVSEKLAPKTTFIDAGCEFLSKTYRFWSPVDSIGDSVLPPDGGYGWVIVAVAFMASVLSDGVLYSFGIYLPIYIDQFNSSPSTVSWISSFAAGSSCILSLFSGHYADKYGNKKVLFLGGLISSLGCLLASYSTTLWQLFLTQGLICGIGYSLAYTSAISVVGQWFDKKRGIAVGISVCGSGIGVMIMIQIQSILLNKYGWQGTLRWLSLITFIGMSICAIFVKKFVPVSSPHKQTAMDDIISKTTVVDVQKTSTTSMWQTVQECYNDPHYFWLYVGFAFASMGTGMSGHIPNFAIVNGMTTDQSRFILSMNGAASAVGRLTVGYIADHFGKLLVLRICLIISSILIFVWIGCTTYTAMLCQIILYGYFLGGSFCLLPSICAELFGVAKLGSYLGLMITAAAWGNILRMPVCGWLYLIQNNYNISLAFCAILFLFAALSVDYMSDKTSFVHLQTHSVVFHHDNAQVAYISGRCIDQCISESSTNDECSTENTNSLSTNMDDPDPVESANELTDNYVVSSQFSPPVYEINKSATPFSRDILTEKNDQPHRKYSNSDNYSKMSSKRKPDQNKSFLKSVKLSSVKEVFETVALRQRTRTLSAPQPYHETNFNPDSRKHTSTTMNRNHRSNTINDSTVHRTFSFSPNAIPVRKNTYSFLPNLNKKSVPDDVEQQLSIEEELDSQNTHNYFSSTKRYNKSNYGVNNNNTSNNDEYQLSYSTHPSISGNKANEQLLN